MATVEELKIRLTAQNDASKIVKQLNSDVARLAATAKNSATEVVKANKNITTGFSGMGRSAGMAGIQVQQLVGQIQGGTNPMLALSQQAADLGFVLGAPLLGAIGGIGASIAMVLLPNLFAASKGISDVAESIDDLKLSYEDLTQKERDLKKLTLAIKYEEQAQALARLKAELKSSQEQQQSATDALNEDVEAIELSKGATKDYAKEQTALNAEIALQERALNSTAQALGYYSGELAKTEEETKKLKEDFLDLKSSLVDQVNTFGMSSTEIKRYEVLTSDYDETQRAALLNLLDHIEAQKQQAELFKKQSTEINTLADGFDRYAESIGTVGQESGKAAQTGMKRLEDGLVDVAMGAKSFKDVFKDMAKSIISDIMRIYIRQQLLGNIGLAGGGSGISEGIGGIGNFFSGMFGGYQAETFAGATPFAGGGYTGNGARSGGIDGKGGFPAILHPQETVIDHAQGQSSGIVVNQTINVSTGVAQTVRTEIASLMPQIAEASKAAVLDARRRGGSFAKGFGG